MTKTSSFTVQAKDCEDFVLISTRFLRSLQVEIDSYRTQLGLPARVWAKPSSVDAVDPVDGSDHEPTPRDSKSLRSNDIEGAATPEQP